jgi:hypothetical protein
MTRFSQLPKYGPLLANGLLIAEADSLDAVLTLPHGSVVVLDLPSLQRDDQSHWQHELNAMLRACGCGEAAGFFLSATVIGLITAYAYTAGFQHTVLFSLILAFTCSLLSIPLGKAFGKLRARHRLTTKIRCLQALLKRRALDAGELSPVHARPL